MHHIPHLTAQALELMLIELGPLIKMVREAVCLPVATLVIAFRNVQVLQFVFNAMNSTDSCKAVMFYQCTIIS